MPCCIHAGVVLQRAAPFIVTVLAILLLAHRLPLAWAPCRFCTAPLSLLHCSLALANSALCLLWPHVQSFALQSLELAQTEFLTLLLPYQSSHPTLPTLSCIGSQQAVRRPGRRTGAFLISSPTCYSVAEICTCGV